MAHKKRKVIQTDELLKLLCTKTGMGQQDLEILLGVKQSNINGYIKGTRSLPASAMIKMAAIFLKVRGLPATDAVEPTAADKQKMTETAAWCRFQAGVLQQKLADMEEACQQAKHMLQFIELDFMDGPLTPMQELWKTRQYHAMQIKLHKNGWMPQQQLRVKIATLLQEAEINEAYI